MTARLSIAAHARSRVLAAALAVALVAFVALAPRVARAQSLPDPPFFDLPVMDPLRRLVHDDLDMQGEQLERWMKYVSVPLTQTRFAEDIQIHYVQVLSALTQIEDLLRTASELGYASEDLLASFEDLLSVPPGFAVQTDGTAATTATRRTLLEIARAGGLYADDLETTVDRVAALKESIEEVGTGFLGFASGVLPGGQMASPTQGARLTVQTSLAATQQLMKRRQQAALQLNSFLVRAAYRMQHEVIARRALECALGTGPCPHTASSP